MTKETYPDPTKVPYHSRWRHFVSTIMSRFILRLPRPLCFCSFVPELTACFLVAQDQKAVDAMVAGWKCDNTEKVIQNFYKGSRVLIVGILLLGSPFDRPRHRLGAARRRRWR